MPRAPITPTIVANPVGRAPYAAQGVVPVQPQQPGMLVQQGQQLQRLGNALEDVDYVQRVKKAEALATESDAKLAESIRNQNSDFGKKEGRDAVDGFENYEKALRESATKMLAGVQDPIAQQAIRESSEKRIQQSLNWAVQHRDKQQEAWLKGSVTAAMQGSVEDYKTAVANGDPDASRFFRTAMLYQNKLDAMNGLDDNQKRINTLAATTMLHGGAVDGMLERNEFGKAAAYLQQNKGEIAQDFYDNRAERAKVGVIEGTARELTSNFYRFEDRLKWVNEKFQGSADDKESLRRHLIQQANLQDAADAQVAADVEKRARQWMAENPDLDIMRDAPELAAEVTRYGVDVRRTRTTDQAWKDSFYDASPAELDRLRALDDNQLHRYLASRLDAHDEATVTKFLRGDQSGASIGERTKVLARQLGILPSGNRDARPEENRAFDAWVANTIDPMIRKRRDELKRDLNVDDFQKLIVNPILQDKVWTDAGTNRQLPLMQLQRENLAPVDNPDTPQDESLNFDAYNSLYVEVGGQQVMLREIPIQVRKSIRDEWAAAGRGYLSVEEEVRQWLAKGAPGRYSEQDQINIDRNRAMREIEGMK